MYIPYVMCSTQQTRIYVIHAQVNTCVRTYVAYNCLYDICTIDIVTISDLFISVVC